MFVSESTLNFMGTKLQFLSAEGHVREFQIDPSTTVENLKRLVFQHFYPEETVCCPENFRVIYPKERRTLGDNHAIHEEHVKDNDVLLFIRKRSSNLPDSDLNLNLKTPTADEIIAATKNLSVPPPSSTMNSPSTSRPRYNSHLQDDSNTETSVDFQLELRKIIISLISVMATLLHANPDAELICQQIQTRLQRRLDQTNKPVDNTNYQYPPSSKVECSPMGIVAGLAELRKKEFRPNARAVEALREMGFQEKKIIEALRATKNSKDLAIEFLKAGKQIVEDSGLDPSSHLFHALVSAPTIRLGLANVRILNAFLTILENPSSANIYLNDQSVSPLLSTIFKIYHAEKHAALPES